MVWRGRERDPRTDTAAWRPTRPAGHARVATVDRYRAGVNAWRRAHPDQKGSYAAKQAVAVILAVKNKSLLRVQ
jgi:hypothetical protein